MPASSTKTAQLALGALECQPMRHQAHPASALLCGWPNRAGAAGNAAGRVV